MLLQLYSAGNIGIYNERLAVTLGLITLVFGLAIFVSCRICVSFLARAGLDRFTSGKSYRSFYRFHSYYWWIFWFVFVLHVLTALMHSGIPDPGDSDSAAHWSILGLGAASFIAILTVGVSCRSLAGVLDLYLTGGPLQSGFYKLFYRYHSYYWLIVLLGVVGHFTSAFLHTGIWPAG